VAWLRVNLTEEEQQLVRAEMDSHPDSAVRRRLWSLWLMHCGTKREQAAKILRVARSTIERDVHAYRSGGLERLRNSERRYKPTSSLAKHADKIRQSLEQEPVRTIAEACQRIAALTGVERKPTQVARFLKRMGLKWQRVRAIPVPPKKTSSSMPPIRLLFSTRS